jgi:uncharacterized protein
MPSPAPDKDFMGTGWFFPVSPASGGIELVQYEADIHQAIIIILQTDDGERIMRPTFGAGLGRYVFEPINPTLLATLNTKIQAALVNWEPRIDVVAVSANADLHNVARVLIDITYRVRATNSVGNLVYPFYLAEGPGR